MKAIPCHIAALVIVAIFSDAAYSQDPELPTDDDPTSELAEVNNILDPNLKIELKVEEPLPTTVAQETNLYVSVTNLSETTYEIHTTRLRLPTLWTRVMKLNVDSQGFTTLSGDVLPVPAGGRLLIQFHYAGANISDYAAVSDTLFMLPREVRIAGEVLVKETGSETKAVPYYFDTVVPLEPTILSPLVGGVVGSVLLALFLMVYEWVRPPDPTKVVSLAKHIGRAASLAVAGSVTSVVFHILVMRFNDPSIPINITIHDFFGGAVIGLFSYKLGEYFYTQFTK